MKRFKSARFLLPFFIYLFIAHIIFFASPFAPSVNKTMSAKPKMHTPLLVVEEKLLPKPEKPAAAITKVAQKTHVVAAKPKKPKKISKPKKRKPIYKPAPKTAPSVTLPTPISSLHSKSIETLPKLELKSLIPNYENKLTFFMQQALKLPKYGEVKVAITLHCSGKVMGVNVLEAQSDENKNYLLEALAHLTFPPFPNESEEEIQTFTVVFFNS